MSESEFARALVVGASSGIGEALARRLAADGARVALVARREDELRRIMEEINDAAGEERAVAVSHDVRAADEVPDLVQEIARRLGGLDLVIYAAGAMPAVAIDEFDTAKDLRDARGQPHRRGGVAQPRRRENGPSRTRHDCRHRLGGR